MMNHLKSNYKRTMLVVTSILCGGILLAAPLSKELTEGWNFKQARLTNW